MTDPMQQFREALDRVERAAKNPALASLPKAKAAVEALHAEALAERDCWIENWKHRALVAEAALAQQGGVKVPDETVALALRALGNYIHYPAHWDTAAYPELADALCELGCPKCRAEFLRLNAARPADQDALAQKLVPYYRQNYVLIAELCDEVLDRSGALLGKLRDAARALRDQGVSDHS